MNEAELERILDDFEVAWQKGAAPALASFLPKGSARGDCLKELIRIDLEYRWRALGPAHPPGGSPTSSLPSRPRLEDYVRAFPELGGVETLAVTLIADEYRVRCWWGDHPEPAEYLVRFPAHGEKLRSVFARVDAQLRIEAARHQPAEPLTAEDSDTLFPAPSSPPSPIVPTVSELVRTLFHLPLLSAVQLKELSDDLLQRIAEPRALAKELLARDWLTPFQVNQLLTGRGPSLVLGHYLLLERLGEGGTGWVFKARHLHMNRLVALKLLRRELLTDPEVVARFYREIQVVSQMSHPHVVHAFDAGPIGQAHVLVMEYAQGTDLARLVKQSGPLPAGQACEYICQAALGLQHIHERGQVHRDVKPSNLLVTWTTAPGETANGGPCWGTVKVLDLGLARLGKVTFEAHGAVQGDEGSSGRLTPDGAVVVGTPDYLAPEQAIDFHRADIRADIYSLGCTLFHLLTGQPPFPGGTLAQKLVRHQFAPPPDVQPLRPDVPPAVLGTLRRMLSKDVAHRFASPIEVVQALSDAMPAIAANRPHKPMATQPEFPISAPAWAVLANAIQATPLLAENLSNDAPLENLPTPNLRRRLPVSLLAASAVLLLSIGGLVFWGIKSATSSAPDLAAAKFRAPTRPTSFTAPKLFSTGIGADGSPLPDGAIDPHWTIRATPAGSTNAPVFVTLNSYPIGQAWIANSRTSRWISPKANEAVGDPPGQYIYQTTFDIGAQDPSAFRVNLRVAVDNHILEVRLNGQNLHLTATGFQQFTPLTITNGFTSGVNYLEFIVDNEGPNSSPSGLRVEMK